jgi:hypothetical protein
MRLLSANVADATRQHPQIASSAIAIVAPRASKMKKPRPPRPVTMTKAVTAQASAKAK